MGGDDLGRHLLERSEVGGQQVPFGERGVEMLYTHLDDIRRSLNAVFDEG